MVVSILWTRKLKFRERRKCIITVEISNGKAFHFCLFCSMLSQQDAHGFVGNHLEDGFEEARLSKVAPTENLVEYLLKLKNSVMLPS